MNLSAIKIYLRISEFGSLDEIYTTKRTESIQYKICIVFVVVVVVVVVAVVVVVVEIKEDNNIANYLQNILDWHLFNS